MKVTTDAETLNFLLRLRPSMIHAKEEEKLVLSFVLVKPGKDLSSNLVCREARRTSGTPGE